MNPKSSPLRSGCHAVALWVRRCALEWQIAKICELYLQAFPLDTNPARVPTYFLPASTPCKRSCLIPTRALPATTPT
eukprot:1002028-Pelagomonas_calceolata.AAC.6